jgi:hypothetical protein
MKSSTKPPVVLYINTPEQSRIKMQVRLAREEYKPKKEHPYDAARDTMPALSFAELILKTEGLIVVQAGVEFVNGRRSSPLLKMREANRVLKRLGLKQLSRDRSWLV